MCLEKITKIYKKPDPKERVGYKVVTLSIDKKTYESDRMYSGYEKPLKTNTWLKSKEQTIISGGVEYQSGFHVFTEKEGANAWASINSGLRYKNEVVVKVIYRNIVAVGKQNITMKDYRNCIVAKEMKVIV